MVSRQHDASAGSLNRIAPFERAVLRSPYGRELEWHRAELAKARAEYGLFH